MRLGIGLCEGFAAFQLLDYLSPAGKEVLNGIFLRAIALFGKKMLALCWCSVFSSENLVVHFLYNLGLQQPKGFLGVGRPKNNFKTLVNA